MNLDRWLAGPSLRTRHERRSPAAPEDLWGAATTIRLSDCRILGRLVRARIPGLDPRLTFDGMFREDPFNLLEEGPQHLLSGLCGRIWTVRRDFTVLSAPEDFLSWDRPGTVRVLFAQWAEPADSGSALVSEVRVEAVDRRAALYLRAMHPFINAFQGLVGAEAIAAAVRRAGERST